LPAAAPACCGSAASWPTACRRSPNSLTVQGHGHIKAHSILQIALATTYVQQREIEQACEVAIQALDLPSDQRIGPIDQRARDLLRELEPWRSTPAVATLAERLATR
jgi:hypothetical protein